MKINAYAKINLTLNVIDKRADKYHNVDMLMQSVSLCDVITVERQYGSIELSGTGELDYGDTNLAFKAAKLFFDKSSLSGGAKIYVEKHIPMCAGMAGGSTDAAAVLKALNELYGNPFGRDELCNISKSLGADVPFCLTGGTMRAEGIGEILTPVAPLPYTRLLVVKPPIAVSTPEAYAGLELALAPHPDTWSAICAIERGDMKSLFSLMGNTFEYSIFKKEPEIAEIKNSLLSLGASASLMSGSGSAVFGIFEDEDRLAKAFDYFKSKYTDVYICHTINE